MADPAPDDSRTPGAPAFPVPTMPVPPVSVVGLGQLGGSLAAALAANGRAVSGWDVDPAARAAAEEHGVQVTRELTGYVDSPSFDAVLTDLARGPRQQGAPAGSLPGRLTIGWGRRDRVTLARQAARAVEAFPDAELHWFDGSGHFPMWDVPAETVALVLAATARR